MGVMLFTTEDHCVKSVLMNAFKCYPMWIHIWLYYSLPKSFQFNLTMSAVEVCRADPLERRLPPPLLPDVDLLDQSQTRQDVGDVIQPPHLS